MPYHPLRMIPNVKRKGEEHAQNKQGRKEQQYIFDIVFVFRYLQNIIYYFNNVAQ